MSNQYDGVLVTESWNIEDVIPYDKNAKIHDDGQIDTLGKIIKENGFDQPIVVDEDGVILKGHGRRLAAMSIGYKKIPVVVKRGLTDQEKTIIRISDNLVAKTEFDDDLLNQEISELYTEGADLSLLAMDEASLNEIIDNEYGDLEEDYLETTELTEEEQLEIDRAESDAARDKIVDREYKPSYEVGIVCADESEQEVVYKKMTKEGYKCKVLIS